MTDRDQKLASPDALLAACDGDERIYDRIRSSLAKAIPQELDRARDYLERGDLAALREAAHKLHGMVATASTSVANVASALEDHAEAGAHDACTTDLTALHAQVPRLLAELASLTFDKLAPP
ncbi:MAG: Hpt domain-containing protein [Kofleriaceae bacterium]